MSMWTLVPLLLLANVPPDGAAQLKKVDGLMPELRRMATDPAVVREVKRQNARRVSLESIRQWDEEWRATPALTPLKRQLLGSPCARTLERHRAQLGQKVAEAFVMDNQGALVGATRRTSDYWQGDEPKWRESFNGGRGGELREKPFFDESSQSYVVQVSLPVKDGARVIGALTVSISLLEL
ncbi:PDC sensor domain-containing protein [Archangium violaceum]|uniref:PDC sensor domain-containing protein n=1 Tax=Archangium violaceum TaxID=83451 RepID=UPI002B2E26F8|nr:PDC sensor domain-containing protein [Archangium gephyra]